MTARGRRLRRRRQAALAAGGGLVLALAATAVVLLPRGDQPVSLVPAGQSPTPVASPTPTNPAAAPTRPHPPSAAGTPRASAAPTAPGPCGATDLQVTVGGGSGGAAGSTYTAVMVRHRGTVACTVAGFPAVRFVDAQGRPVGRAAGTQGTAARVLLRPGRVAHATLQVVDPFNFDPASCRLADVAGYRILLPGLGTPTVVPLSARSCGNPALALLTVGPLQAGPATS